MLAVAAVASVGIVAAWFPTSALLHQRSQLSSASAQLGQLDQQNAVLRRQAKELRTRATVGRIAQQQYDVVPPGEEEYQVLPSSGAASGAALDVGTAVGLGGDGATVSSRSGVPGHGAGTSGSSGEATSDGFFGRVLQTLEFWR